MDNILSYLREEIYTCPINVKWYVLHDLIEYVESCEYIGQVVKYIENRMCKFGFEDSNFTTLKEVLNNISLINNK